MTLLPDDIGMSATLGEPSIAAPPPRLVSDEVGAPIASLSLAKRAALIACLNGGSLQRARGVWNAPRAAACDKPICGVTVADLRRDGLLALELCNANATARLTQRGSWFAKTAATEMAGQGIGSISLTSA
jgi:hypothetical protein